MISEEGAQQVQLEIILLGKLFAHLSLHKANSWILVAALHHYFLKFLLSEELEFEEDAILKIVLNAIHSLIHFDNLGWVWLPFCLAIDSVV